MANARCIDCEYFMGNVGGDRACNALNLPHNDVHQVFDCENFRVPALESEQRSRNAEYFETNSRECRLPANTQYPQSNAEQQERSRTSEDIQRVTEETGGAISELLAALRQVSRENHQRSLPTDQVNTETQELDVLEIITSILTQIQVLESQTRIRPQYLLLGRKTKTALLVHIRNLYPWRQGEAHQVIENLYGLQVINSPDFNVAKVLLSLD